MIMNKYIIIITLLFSGSVMAQQPYGPYNQQFTYNQNQQFGSTNWYSSALGQGVAMGGLAIISGVVNAMTRPDPVIVVQPQQGYQQPSYQTTGYQGQNNNCSMQTLYDQQGNPRYVKVCQ